MQVESALLFETPEEIYARVFRTLRPRTPVPGMRVEFRRFANANSSIRLENGILLVKMTDLLADAPAPIVESLAFILLSKLFRRPVPSQYREQYRLYLNQGSVRSDLHEMRRTRGRKLISGPQGRHFNLDEIFATLNARYFAGELPPTQLGWSRQPSRSMLGHYDPSHHAIILSCLLDDGRTPRVVVEYVLFHEMLHVRYPVQHRGPRRCVHTPEFKAAEKAFPALAEAKRLLKELAQAC